MADLTYGNWKEKYNIILSPFNDRFGIKVKSSEDNRAIKETFLDGQGLYMFKTLVQKLEKMAPESKQCMIIREKDRATNEQKVIAMFGFEKAADGTYFIFVDAAVNGENRTFKAPILFHMKYSYSNSQSPEKDRADLGIGYLREWLKGADRELALGARDKTNYFTKTTLENVANKVGADIAAPKKFDKGGNRGGGSFQKKPPAMSRKVDENEYIAAPETDDDISF